MIAGLPGSYKSTFALNLTVAWAKAGKSGLYISADSDPFTVGKRCAGIISGDPLDIAERTIRTDGYKKDLDTLNSIHWVFRDINMAAIDRRMYAFREKAGTFPDFVVIDNLMNMVDGPGDWNGQEKMVRDLDKMARAASSHVMILHHIQENDKYAKADNAGMPPARHRIMGKLSQFPRLVLTLGHSQEMLRCGIVKNTNGEDQADGGFYVDLLINHENARIVELMCRG